MPTSEELAAEIDQAVEEMVSVETNNEEKVAEEVANQKADEVAASDEENVATEVASVDAAADKKIAEDERSAGELAAEAGAGAERVAQEAAKVAVSDETLARAVNVGIPVADARELSPGLLERIIAARELELEQVEVEDARKIQESPDETIDPFAGLPKLDPEVHDPEVIKAFGSITDIARQQHKEIQDLKTQQSDATLAAQNARDADLEVATQEVEQFFNKQVSELGDGFSDTLGTGDYSSLDRGSPQFAKREAIAGQMAVLFSGYEAQGQRPPPREEIFSTAARIVLRDEFQAVHDKELAGGLEKQAGQHIQRAGGVQAKSTQTPEEEAAQAVDEFLGN